MDFNEFGFDNDYIGEDEVLNLNDLNEGTIFKGTCSFKLYRESKFYDNTASIKLNIDDGDADINVYMNIPKYDDNGVLKESLRKSVTFFDAAFTFVQSIYKCLSGEEKTKFGKFNIEKFTEQLEGRTLEFKVINGKRNTKKDNEYFKLLQVINIKD